MLKQSLQCIKTCCGRIHPRRSVPSRRAAPHLYTLKRHTFLCCVGFVALGVLVLILVFWRGRHREHTRCHLLRAWVQCMAPFLLWILDSLDWGMLSAQVITSL